jgi:hypothetical protein
MKREYEEKLAVNTLLSRFWGFHNTIET